MKNPMLLMMEKRRNGIHCGVPSFCCANKLVIEAILEQSQRFDDMVLIEATSNQVNQFGGYMGMTPEQFREYTYSIADRIGFDREKIILGGDHMGPLPWCDRPAEEAMAEARKLVRLCVLAGYRKIHLDTSMKLGDDAADQRLSDEVIAERGAELYAVCEQAFAELQQTEPEAVHPVYVIGSEVPIPGGAQAEEGLKVTRVSDFENTILTYRRVFRERGLSDAWDQGHIIAIVVQPGVEFGEHGIHPYDRLEAASLCRALRQYPDLVFEGHSTDYQSPTKLKEMVEDGIAIIKVGPALTYAVREAIFALSRMEEELVPEEKRAHFVETLEAVMVENPKDWQKHYHGTEREKALSRKYSFSDRSRYYFIHPKVEAAMEKLFANIDETDIPLGMLHQYMPSQYAKVRDGRLVPKAPELVKDAVVSVVDDYNYAVKYNYMIGGIF